MRTAPFCRIFFGLFACGFSMNLLGTHGTPMLMVHGFDTFTSSMGVGLIGFVAIGGTLMLGRFADRLPRRHILADVYSVRLVGVLYGMAYIGHQIGGTLSAWLGGWAYERYGTHWIAFGAAGVLLIAASLVALQLPRKGFTLMAAPAAA